MYFTLSKGKPFFKMHAKQKCSRSFFFLKFMHHSIENIQAAVVALFNAMRSTAFMQSCASFLFFSFFLDVRILNFIFSVAMISETEHQKIFVQKQDENIEIESLPSVF
jgi:hypothetical protein